MGAVGLYLRYVGTSIRAQLQYRGSVIMLGVGNLLTTGLEFFSVWALFERFGHIRGWSLAEVALLYGMANVAFSIAEAAGHGFKTFAQQVKSGDFDRLLLRPRGTAFQVAAQHLELIRLGRLVQGLTVLGFGVSSLGLSSSVSALALMVAAVAAGVCTFLGLFILQATLSFWTVEGLEVAAIVTYGGVETSQYPLSIYRDGFRRFFTYVVPLAFLNYIPALAILDRPQPGLPTWLSWISPLVGVVFLVICLQIWRIGVRHYRSTGS